MPRIPSVPDKINTIKTDSNNSGGANQQHTAPEYERTSFHCPHCNVYARQNWHKISRYDHNTLMKETQYYLKHHGSNGLINFLIIMHKNLSVESSNLSFCDHCNKYSIWVNQKMIYPHLSTAPLPTTEMPKSVKELYDEARAISNQSPRGACALLRLAIQFLVKELGENEEKLNIAIKNLVQKGLSKKIQQALRFRKSDRKQCCSCWRNKYKG